jgi:hypothetical protein
LVGALVAAASFVPLRQTDFHQTEVAAAVSGVNTLYVKFNADIADVNVIPTDLPDQLVKLDVSATGSTGLFGSDEEPVKVTFNNQTQDGTMTVTSEVTRTESWLSMFNLKVTCNLYVDVSATLNIDAQTSVGAISLSPQVPVVFQDLTLKSTTGSVETNLTGSTVLTRDISVSTTTGSVKFSWIDVQVSGDVTVNVATTTGSVTANVSHNKVLAGNVSIDTSTTTGSVNVGMNISGNVGAHITSQTSTGSITVDAQSFDGNKSPIYSSNYPAASNFLVNAQTTTGSVHLTVAYQSQGTEVPAPEQARDAVISYIRANHPDAAQFITNFDWAGGRQTPEGLDGAETYSYVSQNWNITIQYPVVPNPTYTVTTNYAKGNVSIVWEGTWQNGDITETAYTSNVPLSTQEQVRNAVMNYIKTNHEETAQFMDSLNWTGGRVNTGLLGAEKYVYTTVHGMLGGAWWTVELNYPVVPNPIYTVTANYTQTGVAAPNNIAWNGTWQNSTITEENFTTNLPSKQEQIRDNAMDYIKDSHPETAQFMTDLNWTGGRVDTGMLGAEKYVYTTLRPIPGGAGWTVTLSHPVVPNPVYTVTANYTQTGVLSPYNVLWEGTWQNNTVNQTSYNSNVPVTQEQIRDSIMNYIKLNHNETAQFMQNLNWTGGRVDRGAIVGSELYTYLSGGWNVTMTYPVVLNPIYTVTADYKAQGIGIPYRVIWEGTWQNSTITETNYIFAQ